MFSKSIYLGCLDILVTLLSLVGAQNTVQYYKLSDKEIFEFDYSSLEQKLSFLNMSVDIPTDPTFDRARHPIQKNFNIEDYLIQSISPNDCRTMSNISSNFIPAYHGSWTQIIPGNKYVCRGNITRVLSSKGSTIYMVNLYTNITVAGEYVSKTEVVSIKYNATHINEIKEVDSLVLKYDLNEGKLASFFCLWA